jgi:hypothetical protein
MLIYVQTCREWKELYDLGRRPFGCFVGFTTKDDISLRHANRDYSHFISAPHVYKIYDVHPELTDHFIHSELEQISFQKYNKVCEEGRSADFLISDLGEEESLKIVEDVILRMSEFFYECERQGTLITAKQRKEARNKCQDYHRQVRPALLKFWVENFNKIPKDAKILVDGDAHGGFTRFLIDNEYTDITLCEEILSLPQIYKDKIQIDMNPSGKFTAILTNPPYNVGNNPNYYLKHVEKHRELLEDGGHYIAIMPNRFLAPFSKAGKTIKGWLRFHKVYPSLNHFFPGVATSIGGFYATKEKLREFNECDFEYLKEGITIHQSLETPTAIVDPSPIRTSIINKVINSNFPKLEQTDNKEPFMYIDSVWERFRESTPKGGEKTLICRINETNIHGTQWEMDDVNQAEDNAWFLSRSRLGRFVMYCFANAAQVNLGLIRHMPKLKNIEQTNEFVYNLFHITDDEIKHIETYMK